ncbi:MAG: hypothetical protein IKO37_06270 [Prevotella sp.]|nr:hypothetical protein [Prevotella sp.]
MKLLVMAVAAMMCVPVMGQVTIKGVVNNNRYDDGDQLENKSNYVGWLPASLDPAGVGKAIFASKNGMYEMEVNTIKIEPVQYPNIPVSEYYSGGTFTDPEKALLVTGFVNMMGNSGAVYANGELWTVFCRDLQSSEPEDMFVARHWDATTGKMLKEFPHYSEDKVLESAGMAFNPIDNHIYGLFYVTNAQLPDEITSDPDYFVDEDDQYEGRSGQDAGYAIGRLNTETMEVTLITKGLYYYNFVTFAINSEGRAFALTSGGTSGATVSDDDDHLVDMYGNLTGAQLIEFDLATGNMIGQEVERTDAYGETYTSYEPLVGATGYASQYRRQAACFAKSNPNKMYWNGYVNSGKGIGAGGSWTSLPDSEWRTNGKYDTALYEVDINTGKATRLAKIQDRYAFSCLWVEGDDNSDGQDVVNTGIESVNNDKQPLSNARYNIAGQKVDDSYKGIVIENGKKRIVK